MADRDEYTYMAKLAEQAEKYDEMVQAMKHIVQLKTEMSVEERNLLSVGYKNIIGSRRASWRTICSLEMKEEAKGEEMNQVRFRVIQEYKREIEKEMKDICGDVLSNLDEYLIPASLSVENRAFFLKMKGDYYRYMAEFIESNSDWCDKSLTAYKAALDVASDGLSPTHPIRLGLYLNFSVLYYEVLGERSKAIVLARNAFDDAISQMDSLPMDFHKDATLILQLLKDNISVWTSEEDELK